MPLSAFIRLALAISFSAAAVTSAHTFDASTCAPSVICTVDCGTAQSGFSDGGLVVTNMHNTSHVTVVIEGCGETLAFNPFAITLGSGISATNTLILRNLGGTFTLGGDGVGLVRTDAVDGAIEISNVTVSIIGAVGRTFAAVGTFASLMTIGGTARISVSDVSISVDTGTGSLKRAAVFDALQYIMANEAVVVVSHCTVSFPASEAAVVWLPSRTTSANITVDSCSIVAATTAASSRSAVVLATGGLEKASSVAVLNTTAELSGTFAGVFLTTASASIDVVVRGGTFDIQATDTAAVILARTSTANVLPGTHYQLHGVKATVRTSYAAGLVVVTQFLRYLDITIDGCDLDMVFKTVRTELSYGVVSGPMGTSTAQYRAAISNTTMRSIRTEPSGPKFVFVATPSAVSEVSYVRLARVVMDTTRVNGTMINGFTNSASMTFCSYESVYRDQVPFVIDATACNNCKVSTEPGCEIVTPTADPQVDVNTCAVDGVCTVKCLDFEAGLRNGGFVINGLDTAVNTTVVIEGCGYELSFDPYAVSINGTLAAGNTLVVRDLGGTFAPGVGTDFVAFVRTDRVDGTIDVASVQLTVAGDATRTFAVVGTSSVSTVSVSGTAKFQLVNVSVSMSNDIDFARASVVDGLHYEFFGSPVVYLGNCTVELKAADLGALYLPPGDRVTNASITVEDCDFDLVSKRRGMYSTIVLSTGKFHPGASLVLRNNTANVVSAGIAAAIYFVRTAPMRAVIEGGNYTIRGMEYVGGILSRGTIDVGITYEVRDVTFTASSTARAGVLYFDSFPRDFSVTVSNCEADITIESMQTNTASGIVGGSKGQVLARISVAISNTTLRARYTDPTNNGKFAVVTTPSTVAEASYVRLARVVMDGSPNNGTMLSELTNSAPMTLCAYECFFQDRERYALPQDTGKAFKVSTEAGCGIVTPTADPQVDVNTCAVDGVCNVKCLDFEAGLRNGGFVVNGMDTAVDTTVVIEGCGYELSFDPYAVTINGTLAAGNTVVVRNLGGTFTPGVGTGFVAFVRTDRVDGTIDVASVSLAVPGDASLSFTAIGTTPGSPALAIGGSAVFSFHNTSVSISNDIALGRASVFDGLRYTFYAISNPEIRLSNCTVALRAADIAVVYLPTAHTSVNVTVETSSVEVESTSGSGAASVVFAPGSLRSDTVILLRDNTASTTGSVASIVDMVREAPVRVVVEGGRYTLRSINYAAVVMVRTTTAWTAQGADYTVRDVKVSAHSHARAGVLFFRTFPRSIDVVVAHCDANVTVRSIQSQTNSGLVVGAKTASLTRVRIAVSDTTLRARYTDPTNNGKFAVVTTPSTVTEASYVRLARVVMDGSRDNGTMLSELTNSAGMTFCAYECFFQDGDRYTIPRSTEAFKVSTEAECGIGRPTADPQVDVNTCAVDGVCNVKCLDFEAGLRNGGFVVNGMDTAVNTTVVIEGCGYGLSFDPYAVSINGTLAARNTVVVRNLGAFTPGIGTGFAAFVRTDRVDGTIDISSVQLSVAGTTGRTFAVVGTPTGTVLVNSTATLSLVNVSVSVSNDLPLSRAAVVDGLHYALNGPVVLLRNCTVSLQAGDLAVVYLPPLPQITVVNVTVESSNVNLLSASASIVYAPGTLHPRTSVVLRDNTARIEGTSAIAAAVYVVYPAPIPVVVQGGLYTLRGNTYAGVVVSFANNGEVTVPPTYEISDLNVTAWSQTRAGVLFFRYFPRSYTVTVANCEAAITVESIHTSTASGIVAGGKGEFLTSVSVSVSNTTLRARYTDPTNNGKFAVVTTPSTVAQASYVRLARVVMDGSRGNGTMLSELTNSAPMTLCAYECFFQDGDKYALPRHQGRFQVDTQAECGIGRPTADPQVDVNTCAVDGVCNVKCADFEAGLRNGGFVVNGMDTAVDTTVVIEGCGYGLSFDPYAVSINGTLAARNTVIVRNLGGTFDPHRPGFNAFVRTDRVDGTISITAVRLRIASVDGSSLAVVGLPTGSVVVSGSASFVFDSVSVSISNGIALGRASVFDGLRYSFAGSPAIRLSNCTVALRAAEIASVVVLPTSPLSTAVRLTVERCSIDLSTTRMTSIASIVAPGQLDRRATVEFTDNVASVVGVIAAAVDCTRAAPAQIVVQGGRYTLRGSSYSGLLLFRLSLSPVGDGANYTVRDVKVTAWGNMRVGVLFFLTFPRALVVAISNCEADITVAYLEIGGMVSGVIAGKTGSAMNKIAVSVSGTTLRARLTDLRNNGHFVVVTTPSTVSEASYVRLARVVMDGSPDNGTMLSELTNSASMAFCAYECFYQDREKYTIPQDTGKAFKISTEPGCGIVRVPTVTPSLSLRGTSTTTLSSDRTPTATIAPAPSFTATVPSFTATPSCSITPSGDSPSATTTPMAMPSRTVRGTQSSTAALEPRPAAEPAPALPPSVEAVAAATVATGSSVAAFAGAGAAGAAQAGRTLAVMQLAECAGGGGRDEEPGQPPFPQSLLPWIRAGSGQAGWDRGTIIANVAVMVAAALLATAVWLLVLQLLLSNAGPLARAGLAEGDIPAAANGCGVRASRLLRYPGAAAAVPCGLAIDGVVGSGVALLRGNGSGGVLGADLVLGSAALLAVAAFYAAVLYVTTLVVPRLVGARVVQHQGSALKRRLRFLRDGPVVWGVQGSPSDPDVDKGQGSSVQGHLFLARWAALFGAYRPFCRWFLVADAAASIAIAAVRGARPQSAAGCRAALFAVSGIQIAVVIAAAVLRPYVSPLRNAVFIASSSLLAVAACVGAAAAVAGSASAGEAASSLAVVAGAVLLVNPALAVWRIIDARLDKASTDAGSKFTADPFDLVELQAVDYTGGHPNAECLVPDVPDLTDSGVSVLPPHSADSSAPPTAHRSAAMPVPQQLVAHHDAALLEASVDPFGSLNPSAAPTPPVGPFDAASSVSSFGLDLLLADPDPSAPPQLPDLPPEDTVVDVGEGERKLRREPTAAEVAAAAEGAALRDDVHEMLGRRARGSIAPPTRPPATDDL